MMIIDPYRFGSGTAYDIDYQAWLTQITTDGATLPSLTIRDAQNTLVVSLKGASLWTRMKWGYFLHAGDKTACRRNLKTPGTFRMTEVNTVTFSEGNGCKSDGTSFWNTTIPANNHDYSDFTTVSYISESATASNGSAYGVRGTASGNAYYIQPGVGGSSGQRDNHSGGGTVFASANHKALYVMSYDGTNCNLYRNGVKDSDAQTVVSPTITAPFLICCRNNSGLNGGVTGFSFYTLFVAYVFSFDRFSDSDESALRGILNTYNTSCGLP